MVLVSTTFLYFITTRRSRYFSFDFLFTPRATTVAGTVAVFRCQILLFNFQGPYNIYSFSNCFIDMLWSARYGQMNKWTSFIFITFDNYAQAIGFNGLVGMNA